MTAFQAQHGLKADGVAGEQTLAILYSESAQTFVPTPTPSATPAMLSSGSSGDEVKALQSRLQQLGFYSGVLDGDYGKGTRAAVKLFQAQHGLDDDGIAGQKTLEMLYSNDAQPMLVTPTPAAVQVLAGSQPLLHAAAGAAAVWVLHGPEGGLAPQEEQTALAHGFAPASLGARVLRAETAALAAVSVLTLATL